MSFLRPPLKPGLGAGSLLAVLLLASGCGHFRQERVPMEARINGHAVHLVYDTGSELSLISSATARHLGLKVAEPRGATAAPGKVLTGKSDWCQFATGLETNRLKLDVLHTPWWMGSALSGVIGWPDLKDPYVEIDARHDALHGLERLPADIGSWTCLPLYRGSGVLALALPRADGKKGVLMIDTGNADGLSLSPELWADWRATNRQASSRATARFMFGSGWSVSRRCRAPAVALGPLCWTNVVVVRATRTETGIVSAGDAFVASAGLAALRQWDLIIDRGQRVAYFRQREDAITGNPLRHHRVSRHIADTSTVHLDFAERGALELAVEAAHNGNLDAALTNCSRALELNPTCIQGWTMRGECRFFRGASRGSPEDLVEACRDLSRALELEPRLLHAYDRRALSAYLLARWDDAAHDFQRVGEGSLPTHLYPWFYLWTVRAHTAGEATATSELRARLEPLRRPKGVTLDAWSGRIGAFILDEIGEPAFLRVATADKNPGHRCEAWFYAGMKRLLAHDPLAAREYFKKCLATGLVEFEEYNFAYAELRALEASGR